MDNEKSIAFELIKEQGKNHKMLIIVICILIVCLAFTNMAWLHVWNQYDYEEYDYEYQTEIEVNTGDGSGDAIYQEGWGNQVNGLRESEKEIKKTQKSKKEEVRDLKGDEKTEHE